MENGSATLYSYDNSSEYLFLGAYTLREGRDVADLRHPSITHLAMMDDELLVPLGMVSILPIVNEYLSQRPREPKDTISNPSVIDCYHVMIILHNQ